MQSCLDRDGYAIVIAGSLRRRAREGRRASAVAMTQPQHVMGRDLSRSFRHVNEINRAFCASFETLSWPCNASSVSYMVFSRAGPVPRMVSAPCPKIASPAHQRHFHTINNHKHDSSTTTTACQARARRHSRRRLGLQRDGVRPPRVAQDARGLRSSVPTFAQRGGHEGGTGNHPGEQGEGEAVLRYVVSFLDVLMW